MTSERQARPGKVVCVGRNYRAHAAELGNEVPREPLLFLKPSSSIIHDGDAIVLPDVSNQV
jgi:2-keto-4-pentenoate hydratase/2-oxohepta-3-ene-1,7-dioic acid hydratase in catechol pathway